MNIILQFSTPIDCVRSINPSLEISLIYRQQFLVRFTTLSKLYLLLIWRNTLNLKVEWKITYRNSTSKLAFHFNLQRTLEINGYDNIQWCAQFGIEHHLFNERFPAAFNVQSQRIKIQSKNNAAHCCFVDKHRSIVCSLMGSFHRTYSVLWMCVIWMAMRHKQWNYNAFCALRPHEIPKKKDVALQFSFKSAHFQLVVSFYLILIKCHVLFQFLWCISYCIFIV